MAACGAVGEDSGAAACGAATVAARGAVGKDSGAVVGTVWAARGTVDIKGTTPGVVTTPVAGDVALAAGIVVLGAGETAPAVDRAAHGAGDGER